MTQKSLPTLKYTFSCYKGITALKFLRERSELVVGHSNGVVSVYSKYVSIDYPFCTFLS